MKAQYAIVRTYWRDNRNPFPGRLTETRIERIEEESVFKTFSQIIADPENLEERRLARNWTLEELDIHNSMQQICGEKFEAIVDGSIEGGYQ